MSSLPAVARGVFFFDFKSFSYIGLFFCKNVRIFCAALLYRHFRFLKINLIFKSLSYIGLFFSQFCGALLNGDGQIFSSKMAKNQGPKSQIRPGAKGCKKRFPRDFGNFSQKMSQNVICKAAQIFA